MHPKRHKPTGWLLAAALCAPAAQAQHAEADAASKPTTKIYKYQKDGTTSFSDRPPASGAYVLLNASCYACGLTSDINWSSTQLHLDKFSSAIDEAVRQYALEPALLRALIHAESGFQPRARSPKGAMGLMQLMPTTARQMGVADAWMPDSNIQGGAKYLSQLLVRFGGDVKLAVAAYNAGPEAVRKYAGVPPYAETKVYVQRVQILRQRYKEALRG